MNFKWLSIPLILILLGCNMSSDQESPPPPIDSHRFTISGDILADTLSAERLDVIAGTQSVHMARDLDQGEYQVSFELNADEYQALSDQPITLRASLSDRSELSYFTAQTLADFVDDELSSMVLSSLSSAEYVLADEDGQGFVDHDQWHRYLEYRSPDHSDMSLLQLATAQQHVLLHGNDQPADYQWLESLKDNRNWNDWLANNEQDLGATWESLFIGEAAIELERVLDLDNQDAELEDWFDKADDILDINPSACLISIIHDGDSASGRGEVGDEWALRAFAVDANSGLPISSVHSWHTSNTSVLDITQHGHVTLKSPGVETLSVQTTYNDQVCFDAFDVTVTAPDNEVELTGVRIATLPEWLYRSESVAVKAIGTWSDGTMTQIESLGNWHSSNEAIASFDQNRVFAHKAGEVAINFDYQGESATAYLEVKSLPDQVPSVDFLVMHGDIIDKEVGSTWTLSARAHYSDGEQRDVTHMAHWGSSNPRVVSVAEGRVTALSPGYGDIMVLLDGLSQNVRLTVTETDEVPAKPESLRIEGYDGPKLVGESWQLDAMVTFDNGRVLNMRNNAIWTSSDTSVATVRNGLVSAVDEGSAEISATYAGVTHQVSVEVYLPEPELTAIKIEGKNVPKPIGGAWQLQAFGYFDNGQKLEYTDLVDWHSSNSAIVSVSSGVATAIAPGTVSIKATFEQFEHTTMLTVNAPSPTHIEIDFASDSLEIGQSQPLKAYRVYADQSRDELTDNLIWNSSTPSVAHIEQGRVIANSEGHTTLSARYFGYHAERMLSVTYPVPDAVYFEGNFDGIRKGDVRNIRLYADYGDVLEPQDVTLLAAWGSSDESIVQVTHGRLEAIGVGLVTLSASWNGKQTEHTFEVSPPQLVSVSPDITGNDLTIKEGEGMNAALTLTYSDDSQVLVGETCFNASSVDKDDSDLRILVDSDCEIRALRSGQSTVRLSHIPEELVDDLESLGINILWSSNSRYGHYAPLDVNAQENLAHYRWDRTRASIPQGITSSLNKRFVQGEHVYNLHRVFIANNNIEYWLTERAATGNVTERKLTNIGEDTPIVIPSLSGGGSGYIIYFTGGHHQGYENYIYHLETDKRQKISSHPALDPTDNGNIFNPSNIYEQLNWVNENGDIIVIRHGYHSGADNRFQVNSYYYTYATDSWQHVEKIAEADGNHNKLHIAETRKGDHFIVIEASQEKGGDNRVYLIDKATGKTVRTDDFLMSGDGLCTPYHQYSYTHAWSTTFTGNGSYLFSCRDGDNDRNFVWPESEDFELSIAWPDGYEQREDPVTFHPYGDKLFVSMGVGRYSPGSRRDVIMAQMDLQSHEVEYTHFEQLLMRSIYVTGSNSNVIANSVRHLNSDAQDKMLINPYVEDEVVLMAGEGQMLVYRQGEWKVDLDMWGIPDGAVGGQLYAVDGTWVIVHNHDFWTLRLREQ